MLQLICDGLSNREIAAKLESERQHRAVHRANIMNTLGMHKTAELVVYAHAARPGHRCDEPARVPARRPAPRRPTAARPQHQPPRRRRRSAFGWSTSPRGSGLRSGTTAARIGGKLLPETLGSGCAFLDYDADGWQDILLVNGMDWPGHATHDDRRSACTATTATARSPT